MEQWPVCGDWVGVRFVVAIELVALTFFFFFSPPVEKKN